VTFGGVRATSALDSGTERRTIRTIQTLHGSIKVRQK
jgi:hypothetical protein